MRRCEPTLDRLTNVLERMRGSGGPLPAHRALRRLVQLDYLKFEKEEYEYGTMDSEWVNAHDIDGNMSSRESNHHLQLKVYGARYLSRLGHNLSKQPIPNSTRSGKLFVYNCFEERGTVAPFVADVACKCESDEVILECGCTPADRALSAFGYGVVRDADDAREEDSDNPFSVRMYDRKVDALYLIPYDSGGEQSLTVYKFGPTSSLPDANPGYLGRVTGEAFEAVDGVSAEEASEAFENADQ